MSSLNKLVKGTITIFSSSIIIAFLSYFLKLILARELSLSDFGLTYSVISLFGLIGVLAEFGINGTIIKFISQHNIKKDQKKIKDYFFTALLFQLSVFLIISSIFILFSKIIAEKYLSNSSASFLIIIYASYFLFSAIFSLAKSTFVATHKTNFFAFLEILQYGILFIFTIILLNLKVGINSLFISYLIFGIIGSIVSLVIIKKEIINFKLCDIILKKKILKKILNFGFYILIYNIFNLFFGRLETIFLTIFSTIEEVGIYSAILPTILAVSNLFSSLILVLIPFVSELWAKKKYVILKKNIEEIYNYLFVFLIPVIISLMFYSDIIVTTLFTKKFTSGIIVFKIMAPAILLIVFSRINVSILTGINNPKKIGKIMILSFIVNLVGNLILIPKFGVVGTAYSTIISFSFSSILLFSHIRKKIKIKTNPLKIIKLLIAYFSFFLTIQISSTFIELYPLVESAIVISLSFIIYITIIFLFKILNFNEIFNLLKNLIIKN
jgi:O-antigen/teichoic acid export membrane protein